MAELGTRAGGQAEERRAEQVEPSESVKLAGLVS
jgi:hypothetical protein